MRTRMKELINEVITIVTATGEYVGKLDTLQQDDTSVALTNPRIANINQLESIIRDSVLKTR